jgi:hypothetical protein
VHGVFEHSVEENRRSVRFPGVFRSDGFVPPDIQPDVVGLTLVLQGFGGCWWLAVVICVVLFETRMIHVALDKR